MKRNLQRDIDIRDGIGFVPLTRRLVALVDQADVALVAESNWYAGPRGLATYAYTEAPSPTSMHGLLLGRLDVDHINRNGLDNRRSNLRVASRTQQCANTGRRRDNKSGYRGVDLYRGKWRMQLKVGDERFHRTGFITAEDAAQAYDEIARQKFGEFAALNFPGLALQAAPDVPEPTLPRGPHA